eukprot:SAG31_NODE_1066_length_10091_cov_5.779323_6_plen_61_part_00
MGTVLTLQFLQFEGEEEQRRIYETVWIVIERRCGGTVDGLEAGFSAALRLLNGGKGGRGK